MSDIFYLAENACQRISGITLIFTRDDASFIFNLERLVTSGKRVLIIADRCDAMYVKSLLRQIKNIKSVSDYRFAPRDFSGEIHIVGADYARKYLDGYSCDVAYVSLSLA